jgi:hypothetical protein
LVITPTPTPWTRAVRRAAAHRPAYFGAGYTSWVLVSILLGDIDRRPDRLSLETAAIVSLFTMVVVAVTCLLILVRREPGGASG